MKVHPDKNPNDPEAANNFAKLNQAYTILSNPDQRSRYDKTGDIEGATEEFASAYEYYRSIYEEITAEDIEGFAGRYKGSDDETEDLVNFYHDQEGDMTLLLEHIPCSENEDVPRFMSIFRSLFKQKELKKNQLFADTKGCVRLISVNEDEAAECKKELADRGKKKTDSMASLEAMILKKKDTKESFLSGLAAKYGAEEGMEDEPSEEMFKANMKKR